MISYLLESTICLALLYAFYWLALRKMKLLQLNRIYLLGSIVLALSIPTLDISLAETQATVIPQWLTSGVDLGETISLPTTSAPEKINPLPWIYLAGLLLSFMLLARRLYSILKLTKGSKIRWKNYWLVETDRKDFSSFLNHIFVPKGLDPQSEKANAPLAHEAVHLEQKHSLDLLFLHFIHCLFWFNPLFIAIKKSLKLQHEYIADDIAACNTNPLAYSQALIRNTLEQVSLPMAHSFSEHPVEKRLKMIDNINPTTMKKLRLLWSLPLVLTLMLTFGFEGQVYSQTTSTDSTQPPGSKLKGRVTDTSGQALGMVTVFTVPKKGTNIVKAGEKTYHTMKGTPTNAEGDYLLLMEKTDSVLVFRKQGYEDMTVPYKGQDVINVQLSKKADPDKGGND